MRNASGVPYTFIESDTCIQIANGVFGFDGWSCSVFDVSSDFIEEKNGVFQVGVSAAVRVSLKDGTAHEDVGFGTGEHARRALATEMAKKRAIEDGRRRAFRLFGYVLGNCLYDKKHLQRMRSSTKTTGDDILDLNNLPHKEQRTGVLISDPDPQSTLEMENRHRVQQMQTPMNSRPYPTPKPRAPPVAPVPQNTPRKLFPPSKPLEQRSTLPQKSLPPRAPLPKSSLSTQQTTPLLRIKTEQVTDEQPISAQSSTNVLVGPPTTRVSRPNVAPTKLVAPPTASMQLSQFPLKTEHGRPSRDTQRTIAPTRHQPYPPRKPLPGATPPA